MERNTVGVSKNAFCTHPHAHAHTGREQLVTSGHVFRPVADPESRVPDGPVGAADGISHGLSPGAVAGALAAGLLLVVAVARVGAVHGAVAVGGRLGHAVVPVDVAHGASPAVHVLGKVAPSVLLLVQPADTVVACKERQGKLARRVKLIIIIFL